MFNYKLGAKDHTNILFSIIQYNAKIDEEGIHRVRWTKWGQANGILMLSFHSLPYYLRLFLLALRFHYIRGFLSVIG